MQQDAEFKFESVRYVRGKKNLKCPKYNVRYRILYSADGGDRTENDYDCQNFDKFSRESLQLSNTFLRESQKIQIVFHCSKRESPSPKRVSRKTGESGDPNFWSLISSVSGYIWLLLNIMYAAEFWTVHSYIPLHTITYYSCFAKTYNTWCVKKIDV